MRIERSIIATVAAVMLLAAGACADDDDETGTAQQTAPPEVSYECSPATGLDSTLPVRLVGGGVCGYDDGLGHVYYGVVLQNVGADDLRDLAVAVDVRDGSLASIGRSVPHQVFVLPPGQEMGIGYHSHLQAPPGQPTMQVQVRPLEVQNGPESPADITVSDVATTVQDSSRTTTFTLTSTFLFPLQPVEVFVVYRDASGAVLGGEQDLVENIPAQGRVPHTLTSSYVNPAVTQASVYVNENPFCNTTVPIPGCP
jgi:hypothetical protein